MAKEKAPRPEAEVFRSLRELCAKPGFAHALAYISWRDNTVVFPGAITAEVLKPTYSRDRLIRSEAAVLLGLLVQQPIAFDAIDEKTLEAYVGEAYSLMAEMHDTLKEPMYAHARAQAGARVASRQPTEGEFLREAIFYAPPSAYHFQFLDLAPQRYAQDSEWLIQKKGLAINQAALVVGAISAALHEQVTVATHRLQETQDPTALLPAFEVRPAEIAKRGGLDPAIVDAFFKAFELTSRNENFRAVDDYNETTVFPLIPLGDERFLVFDPVALDQSLYESPIFWMRGDDAYKSSALRHRGDFTEDFSYERMCRVFGAGRVHANVRLVQGKDTVDEIDVLVVYGDRLIILQAKSKGLTIDARKGNNLSIRKDFQGAVDAAYQQALSAAAHLVARDVDLVLADGSPLEISVPIEEIFPFCVVADHYPSLSFQTRALLKAHTTKIIREPFVADVFLLDAMTEMLTSPLRLLGYVKQRAVLFDKLLVGHELTALSFHLKGNLSLPSKIDVMQLGDDIGADLDAAMMVRRMGLPGSDTPSGILTRFRGTPYERLLTDLERAETPAAIGLGFLLLTMGLRTIENINSAIDELVDRARRDGLLHNFSIGREENRVGLTVQVGDESDAVAHRLLVEHCTLKKYQQRGARWFGVTLDSGGQLQSAISMDEPWKPSPELDEAARKLQKSGSKALAEGVANMRKPRKLGVNDPCPCGSTKKYKKCCMWKR